MDNSQNQNTLGQIISALPAVGDLFTKVYGDIAYGSQVYGAGQTTAPSTTSGAAAGGLNLQAIMPYAMIGGLGLVVVLALRH